MGSIFKKIKSISKNGLEPINVGRDNYTLNIPEIEAKAIERSEVCKECDNRVHEPIFMFRVVDKRIEVLNEQMCDICGCSLPYLLRQDIKICKFWK